MKKCGHGQSLVKEEEGDRMMEMKGEGNVGRSRRKKLSVKENCGLMYKR